MWRAETRPGARRRHVIKTGDRTLSFIGAWDLMDPHCGGATAN